MIAALGHITRHTKGSERGQAAVLSLAVVAVLVAIALALVGLGVEGVQRGRLQAVADFVALASARGPDEGAAVAGRNGAELVRVDRDGDAGVTVVVRRDGRQATASAQN